MANWLIKNAEFRRMPLNEALRVKRSVDGYSQQTLAEKLGMYGKGAISKIETGRIIAPRKHMKVICDYLYGEEKGSVENTPQIHTSSSELYSVNFSRLGNEQGLMHISELPEREKDIVLTGLKMTVPQSQYLLFEPFKVMLVVDGIHEYEAMGKMYEFYQVFHTSEGMEFHTVKGA